MAAVHVVRAVAGDDGEAPAAQRTEQVGEQVAGGGVRPVQVFEDDDDGVLGGDVLQEPPGEFEEAGRRALVAVSAEAPARVLAQLGEQPRQFVLAVRGRRGHLGGQGAAQGAQGGGEGGERQPVRPDLDAASGDDDGAPLTRPGGELLDEAGLAHTGLAAEQQRLRLGGIGPLKGLVQYAQFVGPADENRADGPGLHIAEDRTRV